MDYSGLTDKEKWSQFKSGDVNALSLIYTEYSQKLYLYGLKFTKDNNLVEDSIHDLFIELIKSRKNLCDTDNILYYLLKSFKRKLLRNLQKEKRSYKKAGRDNFEFKITWSVEHHIILEEISKQKSDLLIQALNELTPRQKEAIYLKFTKELDYKNISEIMGISLEACRNLISKAVKILKEVVSESGSTLSSR